MPPIQPATCRRYNYKPPIHRDSIEAIYLTPAPGISPVLSRRASAGVPPLDTGFSPWEHRLAGFCLSRLQPGFSTTGFIHNTWPNLRNTGLRDAWTRRLQAPQGRNNIAQGTALGRPTPIKTRALKGRNKAKHATQGRKRWLFSGLKESHTQLVCLLDKWQLMCYGGLKNGKDRTLDAALATKHAIPLRSPRSLRSSTRVPKYDDELRRPLSNKSSHATRVLGQKLGGGRQARKGPMAAGL